MTKKEIERLNNLRILGYGPTRIARDLGLSIGTVSAYIYRHPIPPGMTACKECGALVKNTPGKRPHVFCSTTCKTRWWNKRRTEGGKNLITVTCSFCGKEFMAYESDKRKYCSRDCYHNARRAASH